MRADHNQLVFSLQAAQVLPNLPPARNFLGKAWRGRTDARMLALNP